MLSNSDFKILRAIKNNPEKSVTKISRLVNITFSHTCKLRLNLLNLKLITEKRKDRRQISMKLTDTGEQVLYHYLEIIKLTETFIKI